MSLGRGKIAVIPTSPTEDVIVFGTNRKERIIACFVLGPCCALFGLVAYGFADAGDMALAAGMALVSLGALSALVSQIACSLRVLLTEDSVVVEFPIGRQRWPIADMVGVDDAGKEDVFIHLRGGEIRRISYGHFSGQVEVDRFMKELRQRLVALSGAESQ